VQPFDKLRANGGVPGERRDIVFAPRLQTLDAVRGLAVMGILLLNIVDFAMPGYAYVDPTFYGGADGANWWAWAINFAIADGKMRGLFAMLFGASTALIADRARAAGERAARVHYARMAALLAIGMAHAYLIWSGDILVSYALCGAALFLALRWRTETLLAVAAIVMLGELAVGASTHVSARQFETRATAPGASPDTRAAWAAFRGGREALRATIPGELAANRAGWREVLRARIKETRAAQTQIMPATFPETVALMLLGVALFRTGFFSGTWSPRRYRQVIVAGYVICLPLYVPLIRWIDRGGFDPVTLVLAEPLHLVVLRPLVALAHAAVVILLLRSDAMPRLGARLAATGRMALSNYLATSIVCTAIFCGYGLGWFGYLDRWQLYPVVLGICALMLWWSKPWLDRFAYGPVEWLWRSMTRGRVVPLRQAADRRSHVICE
jgi:uncharacterized protein